MRTFCILLQISAFLRKNFETDTKEWSQRLKHQHRWGLTIKRLKENMFKYSFILVIKSFKTTI